MGEISRAELKYLVERQREEVETLNAMGRLLSSTTDPQEIIRLVASHLHRTFPMALCGILFLPQRRLHLVPFAPIAPVEIASAMRQIREAAGALLHRPVGGEKGVCLGEEPQAGVWMQPTAALRSHLFASITVNGQPIGLLSLFSGQATSLKDVDQHAIGIIAEQLGAALRNAVLVEELRRAVALKNELLSMVSHELSTPLTAIKEGVNLVLDGVLGPTTPDQQDFLKTVVENTERLEQLIQKVKTATEIMTGHTTLTFESFDLRTLVGSLEKSFAPMAAAKGVRLQLVDYPKPLFWQIDRLHVTIALSQLVENAIQATRKEGVVTLELSATPLEVVIQVQDTGVGIDKDALPTLFEQFKSIGALHERKMGGLGLGLFIAKSLMTSHGGTITVDSTLGQGTCMTVRLPKQPATTAS